MVYVLLCFDFIPALNRIGIMSLVDSLFFFITFQLWITGWSLMVWNICSKPSFDIELNRFHCIACVGCNVFPTFRLCKNIQNIFWSFLSNQNETAWLHFSNSYDLWETEFVIFIVPNVKIDNLGHATYSCILV